LSFATFRYATIIAVLLGLVFRPALAVDNTLPDIGSPADTVLTKDQEMIIGRSIFNSLRDAGQILTDPEVQEYIQNLGQRLAANAQNGDFRFHFFVVDEPTINAFALPGGYVGVHSGLILATKTESELAGVLAHEISHVTQRHISRAIYANQHTSILTMAAMLGAILLGAVTGDSNVIAGGVAGAQSMAAQGQINFTRENEYEADRVGVGLLAASGFDPYGMPDFFGTLARKTDTLGYQAPEFLRTHPVTVNRIAETRARAAEYNVGEVRDSIGYSLTRARIRLMSSPTPEKALSYFRANLQNLTDTDQLGAEYGIALSLSELGRYDEAKKKFAALLSSHEGIIHFYTGYAAAQAATGDNQGALATLKEASKLFPRNVPLTIRYAEALMHNNQNKEAHRILLDLYNQVPPTPEQVRQIALAASAAGDTADAHYYMSEYHLLNGELTMASDQLVLALGLPGLDPVQKARFRSRLAQVQGYIAQRQKQDRKKRTEQ